MLQKIALVIDSLELLTDQAESQTTVFLPAQMPPNVLMFLTASDDASCMIAKTLKSTYPG